MPRGIPNRDRHAETRAADSRVAESREFEESDDPIFVEGTTGGFPYIPPIPGFHMCWVRIPTDRVKDLNTLRAFLNPSTYGYTVVRPEEVPGCDDFKMTSAHAGGEVIQYMDTILCKVPERRWKRIHAGLDLKARNQYESLKQIPRTDNPGHAKVPVHLDRNNRPFRTVELPDD